MILHGSLVAFNLIFRTFIAAGQDTTSNTLGSLLYELSRKPILQARLRAEIREMLEQKNGEPLTNADYDGLPFLNACIKVSPPELIPL